MSAYIELGRQVTEAGKSIWAIYKEVKPANEALAGVNKSIEMAFSCLDGNLQANNEQLEKIRSRVQAMHEALVELSKNDESYWLMRSGGNWLQRPSLSGAKTKLLGWQSQFQGLSAAIDLMLPIAKDTAKASGSVLGAAIDVAISGPTSLVGLDTIALNEIATNLSASKWRLATILKTLSNCMVAFK